MRIAATSDTHGRAFTISPCDVFLHAGDLTTFGTIQETAALGNRLRTQEQFRYGLIVPGNHDACFEQTLSLARSCFDPSFRVLVDEAVEIEGVSFYGSPWTPNFCNWHFMASELRLEDIFSRVPMQSTY